MSNNPVTKPARADLMRWSEWATTPPESRWQLARKDVASLAEGIHRISIDDQTDAIPQVSTFRRPRHDEFDTLRLKNFPLSQRIKSQTLAYTEGTSGSQYRPQYTELFRALRNGPADLNAGAERWFSNSPMGDSIRIFPSPLVLTAQEHAVVQAGSAQIGRALQALWTDLVFERTPRILSAGIVPTGVLQYGIAAHRLPLKSLSEIRAFWKGIPREALSFSYGVDLMRTPSGEFQFCEINVGNIGGRADVDYVARRFRNWYQPRGNQSWDSLPFHLPTKQYQESLAFLASSHLGFEPVITQNPEIRSNETTLFSRHIVNSVLHQRSKADGEFLREIQESRAFGVAENTRGLADALELLDRAPCLAFAGSWLGHRVEGLRRFASGRVRFTTAPGTECLLDNKLLLAYWPEIVRFYLKEDPILKAIPSVVGVVEQNLDGVLTNVHLYGKSHQDWPKDFLVDQGVVQKSPAMCQGNGVTFHLSRAPCEGELRDLVGEQIQAWCSDPVYSSDCERDLRARLNRLRKPVSSENELVLLQPIVRPSVLNQHAVDIRPLGIVSGEAPPYLYQVPWGRLSASQVREGDVPMTNVSQGAFELPVIAQRT